MALWRIKYAWHRIAELDERERRERESREPTDRWNKRRQPYQRSALTDLRDNKAAAAADGQIQRRGMAVEQCGIKIRNSKQKKLIKRKKQICFFHELNGPYVIGPRGVRESKAKDGQVYVDSLSLAHVGRPTWITRQNESLLASLDTVLK
jgi:hypothetical protein